LVSVLEIIGNTLDENNFKCVLYMTGVMVPMITFVFHASENIFFFKVKAFHVAFLRVKLESGSG
jgi:hypothetical protein